MAEELDEPLQNAASLLQRQVKTGSTEKASLAFHEAGFADRYVEGILGETWPLAMDRDSVRVAYRQEDAIRAALQRSPSYFTAVASEIGGWTV